MKPKNLISVLQGSRAIESLPYDVDKKMKILKPREIENLDSFCRIMKEEGCDIADFDGFFVSYTISQISKEFDYLRFGEKYIVNIEIKGELSEDEKKEKILPQMQENYYYLKFAQKTICIITYVEYDGFYQYDFKENVAKKIQSEVVAEYLKNQSIDYSVNPDELFVPSNYLISPFNVTEKFMNGEYFLTDAQKNIKKEIAAELEINPFMFFCLSANAGTGKTLLLYDIAKEKMALGKNVLLIHCGVLNEGHTKLITEYHWDIKSISSIPYDASRIALECYDFIFIDEAQRIRERQLDVLMSKINLLEIPTFFSFDTKQYLREGEDRDMTEYLKKRYPAVITSTKKLTNKIRTNKAMSSFINNLMKIGQSKDNLDYSCITIDYIDDIVELKEYIIFLKEDGWQPITYTTSRFYREPYDNLMDVSDKTAHAVIGQEFSKVVFVMNESFRYDDLGRLVTRGSYYSAKGMLYQIATRVVNELKIIVINNPELYVKLLEIKQMGDKE